MEEKIIKTIADTIEVDASTINKDTNLLTDLEIDSLDLMELVVNFEEIYGVEIPDKDLKTLQTVGDVVNYLSKND